MDVCGICGKPGSLVPNPSVESIKDLRNYATERVKLGEPKYQQLAKTLSELSDSDLEKVRYHSTCRKLVVHKQHVKRLQVSPGPSEIPRRAGRPANVASNRPRRVPTLPKAQECIFKCLCTNSDKELHQVKTDARGIEFLRIKSETSNDAVRALLSGLFDAGDAAAQEICYHQSCFRKAQRTCCSPMTDVSENLNLIRALADVQICNYVKSCLSMDIKMDINSVSSQYESILQEYGIQGSFGWHHKKHIKEIIMKHAPEINFVRPKQRNQSEFLLYKDTLGGVVEEYCDANDLIQNVLKVAGVLRKEILQQRSWKFSGTESLKDYQNPPILMAFIEALMCGSFGGRLTGNRKDDAKSMTNSICQQLVHNVLSDRQMAWKSDAICQRSTETPLSVMLPLTLHQKIRSRNITDLLTKVYIGNSYQSLMALEKRVYDATLTRMETLGVCLPDFVEEGEDVTFAGDNIDTLEDTADGKGTFHGSVLVICQKKRSNGKKVNPPLKIPDKVTGKERQLQVQIRTAPVIKSKSLKYKEPKFSTDKTGQQMHSKVWALCSYAANKLDSKESELFDTLSDEDVDASKETIEEQPETNKRKRSSMEQDGANNQQRTSEAQPGEDERKESSESQPGAQKRKRRSMEQDGADKIDTEPSTSGSQSRIPENSGQILTTAVLQSRKPDVSKKKSVMPTWAATRSLVLQSSGKFSEEVNSGVITPLLKTPPTSMDTLFTVLSLAQDISAYVVGPDRKTIITLDMDLYERAMKLKLSGGFSWVLRPGELHICMAALHGLGKSVEGSGLDTVAIEKNVYSAAALRGIYSGKAFKRGLEYHIVNYLAVTSLKLESAHVSQAVHDICQELKAALHNRVSDVATLYEELSRVYPSNITLDGAGDMASWLNQYVEQVEVLLDVVAACREGNYEEFLMALQKQTPYFFQFDLYKYARMITVHLAEMQYLKENDPDTWQVLKNNFNVPKSTIPFTGLFSDQALEQWIKKLKEVIIGITRNPQALDRAVATAPYFASAVFSWKETFRHKTTQRREHYQLSGSMNVRVAENSAKLRECILKHCLGNPYANGTKLKNLVSSVIVPDEVKNDIMSGYARGRELHDKFIQERLQIGSAGGIWDRMKKAKLKTFSNWMTKTKVAVGDKVIKLREERQLLSRFLIIQQSRPEFMPKLEETIGSYELSLLPRSLFATDSSLLIPTDKSDFLHELKNAEGTQNPGDSNNTQHIILEFKVVIIDAMAEVQCLKKDSGMTSLKDLSNSFVSRIEGKIKHYDEARVIFDRYDVDDSLKGKTRQKRLKQQPVDLDIHDEMSVTGLSMRDILSTGTNKQKITEIFGKALIEHYNGHHQKVVVVTGTNASVNEGHHLNDEVKHHSHEEADVLIPMHAIDCVKDNTLKEVHVFSPDTDVLILLIDMVANRRVGEFTSVKFMSTKVSINVTELTRKVGRGKCKGLNGLHNTTGADWGGKMVSISKKKWMKSYLQLPDDDPCIEAFEKLGTIDIPNELTNGELPEDIRPIEHFVCRVYNKAGPYTIPELRWELFRRRNLEGEKLPPTRSAFFQHLLRANYVCMRDKSYVRSHPALPPRASHGWRKTEDGFKPVTSLSPPAPKAVLEMVKCGCKTSCVHSTCSCKKNALPCTPLCKCADCENVLDYKVQDVDDNSSDDEEDTDDHLQS